MTSITMPSITAGTYVLDPAKSKITFSVKHLFGLGTVHGSFAVRHAKVCVDVDPQRSCVDAVIDAASFSTGNPRRDKDIRSARFLDAAAHPEIAFSSTGLRRHRDGTATMDGELTVKGVRTPVTLTLDELATSGDGFRCVAKGIIDRYATAVSGGKGMIGRELQVCIEMHATR